VDRPHLSHLAWTLATIPVLLAASIVRDFLSGRVGVDAVVLLSMATALLLGESFAGAIAALMYSSGNVLEDLAMTDARWKDFFDTKVQAGVKCGPCCSSNPIGRTSAASALSRLRTSVQVICAILRPVAAIESSVPGRTN
jgi:hypothetical protein